MTKENSKIKMKVLKFNIPHIDKEGFTIPETNTKGLSFPDMVLDGLTEIERHHGSLTFTLNNGDIEVDIIHGDKK